MTTIAKHHVIVPLTDNDLIMIKAFGAWSLAGQTCNPKKVQIERGFGAHQFPAYRPVHAITAASGRTPVQNDTTGPNTFKRLVVLGVIEHSRNGHCWLTTMGRNILRDATAS